MKRLWTDADFTSLSRHDNSVHALRVVEGKDGAGEIILGIDHIVEWIESDKRYEFLVAPAELRFRDAGDLRMTLDYPKTSAALGPFTLDRIEVDQSNHWTLKVQTLRVELPPRKYLRDICERHAAAKRDSRV
jgi:hypothetical protein